MTECTPSHCHHHSLSAHLLLKGWNVSGASSWWGITLQRGATPLWYEPPFNTCTPHSKKKTGIRAVYLCFSGAQETHTTEKVAGWLLSQPSTLLRICQSTKNLYHGFWCKDTPTKLTSQCSRGQRKKHRNTHDRLSLEAPVPLCSCTSSLNWLWLVSIICIQGTLLF